MEKRFIDLKPNELIGIDQPIYSNGRQLLKDSRAIIIYNKSYPSATSLLVLSTEEFVKAILVLLEAEGNKVFLLTNAKSFFTSHKIRHNIAQMVEMGQSLFDTTSNWKENKLNRRFTKGNKTVLEVINWFDRLSNAANTITEAKSRIEFLALLDDLKNSGLYVDFRNELLEPGVLINEITYKKVLDVNQRVLRFYKMLKILYNPLLANHMSQKEIDKLKNDLKEFIKVGLEGFSFKELNTLD